MVVSEISTVTINSSTEMTIRKDGSVILRRYDGCNTEVAEIELSAFDAQQLPVRVSRVLEGVDTK